MMDDIYGDLDNFQIGDTIKELQEENAKLTEHIKELTSNFQKTVEQLESVKKANIILQENISKLYVTAKADYDRRTRVINDLRKQLDDLVFKRNQTQTYKIPKRKPEINQEVNDLHEPKKRKLSDVDNQIKYPACKTNTSEIKDYNNSDNRRDRFNKGRVYRHDRRRSRSRSRERRRKSPVANVHHQKNRDYDRNRSRRYSPDIKHQKNVGGETDSFVADQRKVLELIKRKQTERSDTDSHMSDNSTNFVEIVSEIKIHKKPGDKDENKDRKIKSLSKNKNSDNYDTVKDKSKSITKIKTSDDIEEGEVSDKDNVLKGSNNRENQNSGRSVSNHNDKNKNEPKSKTTTNKSNTAEENIQNKDMKKQIFKVKQEQADVTNEDLHNTSTNEDASISLLIQKREELEKEINQYEDDSIINLDNSSTNLNSNDSKIETTEDKIKLDLTSSTEPVDKSIKTEKIQPETALTDTSKEDTEISDNITIKKSESAEKKPRRRRCILTIN